MAFQWKNAFTKVPQFIWKDATTLSWPTSLSTLDNLKAFLDFLHIKYCLLRPFCEQKDYPLVLPQELLPSFEANLYEYVNLPGFSLVVLDRPVNYFQEIFQFDLLHCIEDAIRYSNGPATPFEPAIIQYNKSIFQSRLPKLLQDRFRHQFEKERITELQSYLKVLPYILNMDRGHVMAKNMAGDFYLSGIYASFPSDLDSELKRYGLRIGKFKPGNNRLYELNRNFVYQFLMELYGFPIASERRTSAALFARRLFKMGEDFLIRVLGQSDRTLTTLSTSPDTKRYPQVEKIALVSVDKSQKEQIRHLDKGGFLIRSGSKTAVILRTFYRQHKYDPNNVRTDRALSVTKQEVIHPITGEICTTANIIKDTNLMTFVLNDIIKGEYVGRVKYKRNEIVENTETHEKRLKFLYAWLRKHQRRILGYSDEFYHNVTKVLDNYLLNSEYYGTFQELPELYQEVWKQYSYIQQARKVRHLEDLARRRFKGKKINYLQAIEQAIKILQELKFEIVNYFDPLVNKIVRICEQILNDRYLVKKYVHPPPEELTDYGLKIRKHYGQLVKLLDDFYAIKKSRSQELRPSSAEAA